MGSDGAANTTSTTSGPIAAVDAIIRRTRALRDLSFRAGVFRELVQSTPVAQLAQVLDGLCMRAGQAERHAQEAVLSLVDVLNEPGFLDIVARLREEAAGMALLSLDRFLRAPVVSPDPLRGKNERVPDYGKGRPLTLGERKALARRPDRDMMQRLLFDPNPAVIAGLLRNPKLTEDDVVRLAAKRPGRPEVLMEIARAPKWLHRSRVRVALMANAESPIDVAARVAILLVRQELKLVLQSTTVRPEVRALCLELLARRPAALRSSRNSGPLH